MLVTRFAINIEADIKRGFSSPFNGRQKDLSNFIEACEIWMPSCFNSEKYENLQTNEEKLEWFEDHNVDVRIDEQTSEYCIVHHDGLSVFELEAETIEEAEEDVQSFENCCYWTGSATIGEVKLVKSLTGKMQGWHILEVEDCEKEEQV